MAKTNPKGPGTETFSVNMPKETVTRLRHLAAESDVSLSRYCKRILTDAAGKGQVFSLTGTTTEEIKREKKPVAGAARSSTASIAAQTTGSLSREIQPTKESRGGVAG